MICAGFWYGVAATIVVPLTVIGAFFALVMVSDLFGPYGHP